MFLDQCLHRPIDGGELTRQRGDRPCGQLAHRGWRHRRLLLLSLDQHDHLTASAQPVAQLTLPRRRCNVTPQAVAEHAGRSEEHTSELQSLMRISYAVFCLKKKKT